MNREELLDIYKQSIAYTKNFSHSPQFIIASETKRQLDKELFPIVELISLDDFYDKSFTAKYNKFFCYYGILQNLNSQQAAADHFGMSQSDFMLELRKLYTTVFNTELEINFPISFQDHRQNWIPLFERLMVFKKTFDEAALLRDLERLEQIQENGINIGSHMYEYECDNLPKDTKYYELEKLLQNEKAERTKIERKYDMVVE